METFNKSDAGEMGNGPGVALARFARDDQGVVMNEYVVVMGFVGLVSIPAFTYLGYVVAHSFAFMRQYVLFMFP